MEMTQANLPLTSLFFKEIAQNYYTPGFQLLISFLFMLKDKESAEKISLYQNQVIVGYESWLQIEKSP